MKSAPSGPTSYCRPTWSSMRVICGASLLAAARPWGMMPSHMQDAGRPLHCLTSTSIHSFLACSFAKTRETTRLGGVRHSLPLHPICCCDQPSRAHRPVDLGPGAVLAQASSCQGFNLQCLMRWRYRPADALRPARHQQHPAGRVPRWMAQELAPPKCSP